MTSSIFKCLPLVILALSCGQKKETRVDGPGGACGTVGGTRTLQCGNGQNGTILEVCSAEGWKQELNTCEQAPPACTTGVSFAKDIKPIIDQKCVSCHSAPQNYADYDTAKTKIDAFITRINLPSADTRKMPKVPAPDLSPNEKKLFSDWKNAGLSQNGDCEVGAGGTVTLDYIETLVLNDLNKIDSNGRANTRYLVTGHRMNSSSSGDMALFKHGLDKALNTISTDRLLTPVTPLDEWGTVYRLDLRSYRLTPQDWNIVVGADPFKFVSFTSKGNQIKALAGTSQPWLHGDNFSLAAMDAPQYNRLAKIPATRDELFRRLGVDFQRSFDEFEALMMGFFGSPISENKNRLMSRHETTDGFMWVTYDPVTVAGPLERRNLFEFPLLPETRGEALFQFDAGEFIFTLPNGLQGYALYDAAGRRADAAPLNIVVDIETPFNPEIRNGLSCSRCHALGIIPAQDQIRDHVLTNASEFNRTDVELVRAYYRGAQAGSAAIAEDNKVFLRGLEGLGIPAQKPDPLNCLTDNIRRDWTIKDAAGFVMMSEEEFRVALNGSAQGKAQIGQLLAGGTVSLQQFINTFPILVRDFRLGLDPIDQ